MDELGLHLEHEHHAKHTVKVRTVERISDII